MAWTIHEILMIESLVDWYMLKPNLALEFLMKNLIDIYHFYQERHKERFQYSLLDANFLDV